MPGWRDDELDAIAGAEELDLASVRRDGTLRPRVTMGIVRDGDDLYLRSVNGRGSSWFRGAQTRHEARVHAGVLEKDEINDDVYAAYRLKYGRRCPTIVPSIVAPAARAATLKLVPRARRSL